MGVVPDGFLSGAEQELVAVRFFPELAQHTIPLAMNGQIKCSREFNDYACGYAAQCVQMRLPLFLMSHINLWLLCLSLLQSVRQIWDSVFDLCPCGLHGFEVSIFQLWAFIQQVVCGPVEFS